MLVSSLSLTTVTKAIKYFRDVWAFLLEDASESVIQYLYIGQYEFSLTCTPKFGIIGKNDSFSRVTPYCGRPYVINWEYELKEERLIVWGLEIVKK